MVAFLAVTLISWTLAALVSGNTFPKFSHVFRIGLLTLGLLPPGDWSFSRRNLFSSRGECGTGGLKMETCLFSHKSYDIPIRDQTSFLVVCRLVGRHELVHDWRHHCRSVAGKYVGICRKKSDPSDYLLWGFKLAQRGSWSAGSPRDSSVEGGRVGSRDEFSTVATLKS